MLPYKNPELPVEDRVTDLLDRMTLPEKAALICHSRMTAGPIGDLPGDLFPSSEELISERGITHFAMMAVPDPVTMATWNNHVQDLAAATRLGIPVTLSSDPRHGWASNPATAHSGGGFSAGPEPIGLAATDDPDLVREFAAMASAELRAVGIRVAFHPMADLATEPRWARISGTFGEDADRAVRMIEAYIAGMQGGTGIGPDSVACMVKHFPGNGPQAGGEDPHFAYGRDAVYPGGMFEHHLRPFDAALAAGSAQVMTCYSIARGIGVREVGASFNRELLTGLLRGRFGFDGVICTDFNVVTGMEIPGVVSLPPRDWGVEDLDDVAKTALVLNAGADQLGGESDPGLVLAAVSSGAVPAERIDEAVRRILRDKFRLGLFENPYVDVDAAAKLVGASRGRELGRRVQARSLVGLKSAAAPVAPARIYVENIDPAIAAGYGEIVSAPEDADLALVRLKAPYDKREGLLESAFHAGSLEFPAEEIDRLRTIAERVPLAVEVYLDRPAVLTPIAAFATVLAGGFGADDDLALDVLTGRAVPPGVLPFDLPRSQRAVEESRADVPFDTADPLYRCGHRCPRA
ncbi:hypothetical protein KGQ20_22830 [Catenulispora sp. NF23]|uniref:glycoside hydrolase family 3 protein n=1 Tax=Catenulispora pinistramenti TaxID=2705254 RepID=UPI001BA58761|nr:glycoside hydrolase family 3 N-terminal domain-containing protein [Catenulispora pinistramenti]MBS2535600.1 hypothetical protein [Catenulispora pinistramenti]